MYALNVSLLLPYILSNVKTNFVIFCCFELLTTILLFYHILFQIMATKSINEMSFFEKGYAVRNPEVTPEERNEFYNAWAIDAGYEKVLFHQFTYFVIN